MSDGIYLGDAVFAEWHGNVIKLTTSNGRDDTNTIWIEPSVYAALIQFVERSSVREDRHQPQEAP